MNNTIITRCFTVYQLADIVINQLPEVIQQYNAKMVVISDLLDMFVRDPQIEANEARHLINEIVNSVTKTRTLEDVLVIVSFVGSACNRNNDKPFMSHNKTILPRFDKCIEITNDHEDRNKMIGIKIRSKNRKMCKNTTNDFHGCKLLSINKGDLLTVTVPMK